MSLLSRMSLLIEEVERATNWGLAQTGIRARLQKLPHPIAGLISILLRGAHDLQPAVQALHDSRFAKRGQHLDNW